MSKATALSMLDADILRQAAIDALSKLAPRKLVRNPVIFVTGAVAALVTLVFARDLLFGREGLLFTGQIAAWLWFTVLFANFAEAVAEGRGKAQAESLRRTRTDTTAKAYLYPEDLTSDIWRPKSALDLRVGDLASGRYVLRFRVSGDVAGVTQTATFDVR